MAGRPVCCGSIPRLEDGVFNEGEAGFFGFHDVEFRLGQDFEVAAGQELIELADLAGIVAGENDALTHAVLPSRVVFWCALSSPIPFLARANIWCISCSLKGWPSAVPCTSMNSPVSVMTMFMSVSALESSG